MYSSIGKTTTHVNEDNLTGASFDSKSFPNKVDGFILQLSDIAGAWRAACVGVVSSCFGGSTVNSDPPSLDCSGVTGCDVGRCFFPFFFCSGSVCDFESVVTSPASVEFSCPMSHSGIDDRMSETENV